MKICLQACKAAVNKTLTLNVGNVLINPMESSVFQINKVFPEQGWFPFSLRRYEQI